ncbi:MAG TPA: class I SAM-dependent rRNA methyltransferase [Polyangiaceae bacterium]|nr:class I SAM-dependent rRNA methyltransferase [Polyangiaceae bacterium]
MSRALPSVDVPGSLERALSRGHPWVYRNHVPSNFRAPAGWVRVKAGRFVGYGLWDESSPIALRMFSARGVPDAAWLGEQAARALELRARLLPERTTAFRWLYGEGDGLPGITVDVYGEYAVIVTYADALELLLPDLVAALRQNRALAGIVFRPREGALRCLWGRMPPRDLIVEERGVRLQANLHEGQKTGLFLDHRDNREFIRGAAAGMRVLNLFAYTGAFSLFAALGGASHVTSVDAAAPSMAAARDNFALNGLNADAHAFAVGDVYEFLSQSQSRRELFDVVVCDPPSFAKNKEQKAGARKAYARLNARALGSVQRGGLFAAASCTGPIGPEEFRVLLAEAADAAKRRFQIIHDAGQAIDHPVMAHHIEGRYLKFVVGRVLDLA